MNDIVKVIYTAMLKGKVLKVFCHRKRNSVELDITYIDKDGMEIHIITQLDP